MKNTFGNRSKTDDRIILEWAAQEGRILLTHDVRTMPRYAYERVIAGKAMPGVIAVIIGTPIGPIIEDILLIAEYGFPHEWEGQVRYLPLR